MQITEGGAPWLPSVGNGPASGGPTGNGPVQATYTPYSTPIPGVALYGQAAAAAQKAYAQALAQLNQNRGSLLRSYGYLGDIDSKTGTVKNVRVDPHNPYGQFQQLLRNSALASEAAVDDAVGRGIHGGLAHQAESQVQYEHGMQSAQLGQALTDSLSQLQQEQSADAEARDQALYQAELDQLRTAMDTMASNGSVNPANDAGLTYPDYGSSSTESAPAAARKPSPGSQAPKNVRYFTYKRKAQASLKPGQTVHFKRGRGYYAA